MPQGVVIFAGNNARKKGWAYRDLSTKLHGYLALDGNNDPVWSPVPTDKTKRQYTATTFSGLKVNLIGPAKLNGGGNDVSSALIGLPCGRVKKEDLVDAAGNVQMRSDSTGMFEVVAKTLQKLYALPKGLVKEFANVHDDFAEGGTKADSKKNFFAALKEAPGPGGASELDFFAYAGHGNASDLGSSGVKRGDIGELVKHIKRLVRSDGTVLLYACMTGKPTGFAQQLSAQLPPGMTVWGHLPPPGPASINPRKVRYRGGEPVPFLEEFTKAELAKWEAHMISNPDFYARFAFMTTDQIRAELGLSAGVQMTFQTATPRAAAWVGGTAPKGKPVGAVGF